MRSSQGLLRRSFLQASNDDECILDAERWSTDERGWELEVSEEDEGKGKFSGGSEG